MLIEQTVEIPKSRKIHLDFDLPETFTASAVRVVVMPVVPEYADKSGGKSSALLNLRGSSKGTDTLDAYFARKARVIKLVDELSLPSNWRGG